MGNWDTSQAPTGQVGPRGGLFRGSSPHSKGPSHLLPSWVPTQLWPARPSWKDCIQNSCEPLPSNRGPPCSLTHSAADMRLKQQHQAPGLHRNHCVGRYVLSSPGRFLNSQHGDPEGGCSVGKRDEGPPPLPSLPWGLPRPRSNWVTAK